MAESTLATTYTELQIEAARIGGLSVSSVDWSVEEQATLDRILKRGLRHAYYPEIGHDWRFLTPMSSIALWVATTGTASGTPSTTLTATTGIFQSTMVGRPVTVGSGSYTIAGYTSSTVVTLTATAAGEGSGPTITIPATDTYRLPDNFGEIVSGKMWFTADQGRDRMWAVERDIDQLYQMRSDEITGIPAFFGIDQVVNASGQQRYDMVIYPQPDQAYTLSYRYRVQPDVITSGSPYAYGPVWFADVLMEAVRAEAEFEFEREYGQMKVSFDKKIAAAVVRDLRSGPKTLGPMRAPSAPQRYGASWDRTVDVSY